MKFSIIIPSYNGADVIGRSVNSAIDQTFSDFEVIIVDDGSTDNMHIVCRAFTDRRIRYHRLKLNSGVHVARNKGISMAEGEYILLLDGDDELMPHALSTVAGFISQHPDAGLISARCITDDGELTGINVESTGYVRYEDLICSRLPMRIKQALPVIKSSIAKKHKFVAPNTDYIFYRYVMRDTKNFFINEPLAYYHMQDSPNSLHVTRKKPNIDLSIKRARAIDEFLLDFKNDYVKHCSRLFANYAYSAAIGLLLAYKYKRAIVRSYEAARYSKLRPQYVVLFLFALIPGSGYLLRMLFRIKKWRMEVG